MKPEIAYSFACHLLEQELQRIEKQNEKKLNNIMPYALFVFKTKSNLKHSLNEVIIHQCHCSKVKSQKL